MPSTFSQIFAGSVAAVLYGFIGEPATYTPPAGSGPAVPGLTLQIERSEAMQSPGQARTAELQTANAAIAASALAKPLKDGRFSIVGAAEVWTIETTPALRNGQFYFTLRRRGDERMGSMRGKD